MDRQIAEAVAGGEAYIVGGALRDELLGLPVVDVDVACRAAEAAARRFAAATSAALFALSDRHGAWRAAFPGGRTVDFTPLKASIEDDLRTRDFTVNAIARRLPTLEEVDPLGGRSDLEARRLRAVSEEVFRADPVRLLRAVRLEDELGLRLDEDAERLVRRDAPLVTAPAGERILAELVRLSPAGWRRLDELGLLAQLGGSLDRLDRVDGVAGPDLLLVAVLGRALLRLPISRQLERMTRVLTSARPPKESSPRAIHRFRRATEPWSVEALAYLGAPELVPAVERARAEEPDQPLLRGDELGLPPGPEIGRMLEVIEEERAAGTNSTKEEALALARKEGGT